MSQIEIKFRDLEKSDFIYNNIWDHAEKLNKFYPKILSTTVTVSAPHHNHNKGTIYHIQIRLHIAGHDIVINKEPEKDGSHEDFYVCIRDAFDAATKQLETLNQKQHGFVKHHENERNTKKSSSTVEE